MAWEAYEAELAEIDLRGEKRRLLSVEARRGPYVKVKGRWYLNLSSNDYLGLASQVPWGRVAEVVHNLGLGAGASRLLSGNHDLYEALENELARLYGRPALVFGSGYMANLGIISALVGRKDVIFADRLIHASLIDGLRLSGATFYRYPHGDMASLERLLRERRSRFRRALIVTESIFSMDGDLADLKTLVRLKDNYGAMLLVDEAHAIGVRGEQGLGLAEELDLLQDIDIIVGTFGKALGVYGAFAIIEQGLKEYLINKARSFVFTTALPAPVVAAALWAVRQLPRLSNQRRRLRELATGLREALSQGPYPVLGESQIVPIILGENQTAVEVSQRLRKAGFFVLPIRPPTVPRGAARMRLSLSSEMTWKDLAGLVELVIAR
ncbi:aminotransferase class I/II-fold pyridoxal phosphate-dependent enzyme [Thermosulfuriphilus sp.]